MGIKEIVNNSLVNGIKQRYTKEELLKIIQEHYKLSYKGSLLWYSINIENKDYSIAEIIKISEEFTRENIQKGDKNE